jgi:hypothetical protein
MSTNSTVLIRIWRVLTVGYKTQNHSVSGLVYRPEFLILENTIFRKLGLFSSSGEGMETFALLGPLEKTN